MEIIQNLMSVQDFAELMSKNVAFGTNKIYGLVKEPGFPSIKIGGRYYILVDKVNDWLEEKSQFVKGRARDRKGSTTAVEE